MNTINKETNFNNKENKNPFRFSFIQPVCMNIKYMQ